MEHRALGFEEGSTTTHMGAQAEILGWLSVRGYFDRVPRMQVPSRPSLNVETLLIEVVFWRCAGTQGDTGERC